MSNTPDVLEVEASWSLLTVDPNERAAVCVRRTSDPDVVLLEMQRGNEPMLQWFLHRSVMRSMAHQFAFWHSEFAWGPDV
jgi:hypothetical protein